MDAEQIKTLLDMRMAKYPDHACMMQELTFKDEKIAALEAENARLKEALRECVEVLEKFTCPECKPKNPLCVVTGEPPCEIVSIPKKAREVLSDA